MEGQLQVWTWAQPDRSPWPPATWELTWGCDRCAGSGDLGLPGSPMQPVTQVSPVFSGMKYTYLGGLPWHLSTLNSWLLLSS